MIKLLNPEDIEYLVVHCSDSPHGRGDGAPDIHQWHIQKGWDCIGYHRVITETGQVQQGRPAYLQGAHCYGYNSKSLGVCLIGKDSFTDLQFAALKGVLSAWMHVYPKAKVVGHYELNTGKTCPNFGVQKLVCEMKCCPKRLEFDY